MQADGTKVLVTFLLSKPTKTGLEAVLSHVREPEKLAAKGAHIYLYCPNGYGKSKLSNVLTENKLGIEATTRNWKSVCKLHELSMN